MNDYLFNLTPQLLHDAVLTMISVLVLFTIASNLLFNPVRKMLKDRTEKIKGELDDAKKNQDEALALKKEYEAKLAGIEKEAEAILEEARKKALANEKSIVDAAREEAARIRNVAMADAELEKKKAVDDVKREIVSVAAIMAAKVVSDSIDVKVRDGLIDETLKEIGGNTWLS